MSTRISNLTPGLMTLPYPYRGALAPGRGCVVSDAPAVVLANLGGIVQVEGVYRLDLSSEPGQAAFDPAPGLPAPPYTMSPDTRPVLAAEDAGFIIFVSDDGQNGRNQTWNGTAWINYEGVLT